MQDYSGYGQPTMPMPPMPPPPRRRVGALSYLLVALVAGALGAGSVVALYHPASNSSSTASPQPSGGAINPQPLPSGAIPRPSTGSPGTSVGEQAIVNKVAPGLVIINTTLQYSGEQAAATGMVISSDGLVLTNNHVIEDSTSISARTATGKTYTAKIVGYDPTGDVALIKLQGASGLRTVPIGNSTSIKAGDSVVAMGNAEGRNAIVPVAGHVTALNQTITAGNQGGTISSETLHGMIETNADIVSGDSGGALADSAGQVIGINTAGNDVSTSGQSAAGFAIPIDTALTVARQIAAGQATSAITIGYPPFMGIYIASGSDSNPRDQAAAQGGGSFGGIGGGFGGSGSQSCYTNDRNLPAPSAIAPASSGTLVIGTICNGPAAAAGLTAGSVITAVNGHAIGAPDSLTAVVSKDHPGDVISVTWVSPSGQRSTSNLTLGQGPPL